MKTYQINSYFAVLIITLFGAAASMVIIRVAYNNSLVMVYSDPIYAGN